MTERLGRYFLDRRIATGGMAEVFLARQSGPDGYERLCVVKRMLSNLSDDRTFVRMFLDEARLAAQLTHPNIAQIYDFGEERGAYYLAMEYVPGASVRQIVDDHLTRKAPIPFPLAAKIALELAVALDFAHNSVGQDGRPLNVIHRDVSPHNILLSTTGVVKLIDFGIAKASSASAQTAIGMIKGKFAYMSPEQIRGGALDRRTDLYSLGLVLYEVLTNHGAFEADTERQLQEMVYYGRIRPIEQIRPDVPAPLRRLLGRALAKEPEGRYSSGAEMIVDLERYLAGAPGKASARELVTLLPESARAQVVVAPKRPSTRPVRSPQRLGEELPPTEAARLQGETTAWQGPPTLPPDAPATLIGETTIPDGPVRRSANGRAAVARPQVTLEDRVPTAPPRSPPREPMPGRDPSTARDLASIPRQRSTRGARPLVVGLGVVMALAAGAGIAWFRFRPEGQRVEPLSPLLRRSVAIVGFQNLGARPEKAWLSTALPDMVGAELAATGRVRVVPGDEIARMGRELAIPETGALSQAMLQKIGRDVGSDWILSGAFLSVGESGAALRVDLRLQRADGEGLSQLGESGSETALADLATRLAAGVRGHLGVAPPAPDDERRALGGFSSNPDAARDAAMGVAAWRRVDLTSAREALERAVAEDPDDARAQSALAEVLWVLGNDEKALAALQKAADAAERLPRAEGLRIQGRQGELRGDWAAAVASYRTLATFFTDDVESGLALSRALRHSGDVAGAEAALSELQRLGPPLTDDPRIDLEDAALAREGQGDLRKAIAAAQRAAEKAKATGAVTLLAQARIAQGTAEGGMGEKALEDFDEAKALCEAAGDRLCVATALLASGVRLGDDGDLAQAQPRLEQGIAIAREVSANRVLIGALDRLGGFLARAGELRAAREPYAAAAQKARELESGRELAHQLFNLARVDAALGDAASSKEQDEARQRLGGGPGARANAPLALAMGELELRQGELATARLDLERAVNAVRTGGDRADLAAGLEMLGRVLLESDAGPHAKEVLTEAASLSEKLGVRAQAQSASAALAVLEIDDGQSTEAVQHLRDAARKLAELRALDAQARALLALATALQREGYVKDASDAAKQAAGLKIEDTWTALSLSLVLARGRFDPSQGADPASEFAPLRQRAAQLRYPQLDFEAQLAIAELDLAAGNKARAHLRANALAKDAGAKGFARIARRATGLARR